MAPPTFDQVVAYALMESRRITAYMAFGVNCAEDSSTRNFQLATPMQVGINSEEQQDSDTVNLLKNIFKNWIIANTFRSQIDLFEHFLQQTHLYLMFDGSTTVHDPSGKFGKTMRSFNAKNVFNKLQLLNERFGITIPQEQALRAMNAVRRCIVHRQGRVGREDCNVGEELVLKWPGWTIERKIDGDFVPYPDDHRGPALAGDDREARLMYHWKERRFTMKEYISLSAIEIGDLCLAAHQIIHDTSEAARPKIKDFVLQSNDDASKI